MNAGAGKHRRAAFFCAWVSFAVFCPPPAGAQDSPALQALVGAQTATELLRGETVVRLQSKNPAPAIAPANAFVRNLADGIAGSLKPSFLAESLFLYRKPDGRTGAWTEAERKALYNETLALSTLAGIQYYSPSRNETRTFYETSTVVSGRDGKKALPDPAYYPDPPAELSLYARQKDLTFGENVYHYDFYYRPDALVFVQENVTALTYGIIPAVGKNKLRSVVAVIDSGEYLLIYTASMAKAAAVPGIADRVGRSFSSRAEAVIKWFTVRAGMAFGRLD